MAGGLTATSIEQSSLCCLALLQLLLIMVMMVYTTLHPWTEAEANTGTASDFAEQMSYW
jgi:hypothetical protein